MTLTNAFISSNVIIQRVCAVGSAHTHKNFNTDRFMKKTFILLTLLCVSVMGWAISEYCDYTHEGALSQGDSKINLSWNTNEAGDVVITIGNATDNGHTMTFRNNESPFETDGSKTLAPFTVLSGDGFATSEPANKYFSLQYTNGTTTFTMKRNGSYAMPSPAKIHFDGHAIAWYDSYEETTNKWVITDGSPKITFDYTYGTVCGSTLTAPVISVNSNGEVSFAAVDGADSYKAYVFQGSEFIKTCPITSGQKVWNPVLAGEYAIYVRAFNSSTDAYSDFSNSAIWNATGDPEGDMPRSTVCHYGLKEGTDEEAFLTFYTDRTNGRFYITINAGENGDDSKTFFRDAGGLALDGFQYDGNSFTDYFTRIPAENNDIEGKVNTLTFVPRTEEGHIPEYGHSITFSSGHYVTWRTYNNGSEQNPWADNLSFNYVYGSDCNDINDHVAPIVTVSTASTTTTSATLQIDITDVNDFNESGVIRSITVRDEANSFAERKVTLNGSNQVTLSALTVNTIYNFTVKVTDEGGNVTEETIKVPLTFDPTVNLALNKHSDAGCANGGDTANKANDGDVTTHWGTYGQSDKWGTDNWWWVDLGEAYNISQIKVNPESSNTAAIQGSMDGENWSTIVESQNYTANSIATLEVNASARYLKIEAGVTAMFSLHEFEVYGTAYAVADATAPEIMVTEKAKTVTSVTLQIDATDADDAGDPGTINAIHISGDNDFAMQSNVNLDGSNQITLSGLKDNKTYTFTVHVLDLAGNETTQNIVVELPFNTELNLALNKPCTGGYCQFNNSTEESRASEYKKANDGNTSVGYSAYGAPSADEAWWQVDLEAVYNVNRIKVNWASDYSTGYAFYGSLDGTNWYLIAKDAVAEAGYKTTTVSAPAQYIKVLSYNKANIVINEVEVYASGFSTLTDAQPVLTYAELLNVTDGEVTFEVGGVDQTTAPVQYYVTGIGGAQTVSVTNNILTLSITPNSHYDVTIQAVDADGNKSTAKPFSFGSAGSITGIYLRGTFPSVSWGTGSGDLTDNAQLTTTAEAGIYSVTVAAAGGTNYEYKLYNVGESRWTDGDPSAVSSRYLLLDEAADVTIYAKSEDYFYSNYDAFVLTGTAVGEGEKALVWNADHTKATWVGTIVPEGTFMLSHTGGTHPFFASAQTFEGDYTYGEFTLDITKMTGTWDYVGLSFADNAENENSTIIATYADKQANVTLNRNILADGTWYTLCLPFDMSAEKVNEVFGASTIAELTSAEDRGSLIHLNFDYVHAIEAGKAYLIKTGNDLTAGTVIPNVQIKNVAPIVSVAKDGETDLMHFQGTYNQITLRNSNIRFVADDDYLYSPNSANGTVMGAFRCYFTIPTGSPASAPGKRARIVMGEQTATGVQNVQSHQVSYTKMLRDGQLLIIREGRMYNAQGMIVSE